MLVAELQKYACTSRALRRMALKKQAGIGNMLWRGGKWLAGKAVTNPQSALVAGFGTAAALGKGRSTMAQFDPAVHRAQLGIAG